MNPMGVTNLDDVADKPNWSWVAAREEDVFALQPNTSNSVVTADAAMARFNEELDSAFMTNASTRLQGERVTAFQVDRLVSEQDESLSSVLTHIAQQVQRPVITRMTYIHRDKIPKELKEMIDKKYIILEIKTGLDALGRQLDTLRLQAVIQTLASIAPVFPGVTEKINADHVAEDFIRNSGLNPDRYAFSAEQVAANRQAAQEQAVQQAAAGQAITSAGKIAENQSRA
jgi:hypothetical protein